MKSWEKTFFASFWKNGSIDRKKECDKCFNYSKKDERGDIAYKVSVLKSTMIGSTYYAAVDCGYGVVKAIICKTKVKNISRINIKALSEDDENVDEFECPRSILNLLTPTNNIVALKWREKCIDNLMPLKRALKNISNTEMSMEGALV